MDKSGVALLKATALAASIALLPTMVQSQSKGGEISASARLSPDQYKQSITDIFGPAIQFTGRFEPGVREDGMLALGARKVGVTDAGLDRYDELARSIAQQVIAPA